jgi:hypothetical protein
MVEVHDLYGTAEALPGDIPDPFGPITAEDDGASASQSTPTGLAAGW